MLSQQSSTCIDEDTRIRIGSASVFYINVNENEDKTITKLKR